MTTPLTKEQIESVVAWMNEWEQIKDTAIPLRFREAFSEKTGDDIIRCQICGSTEIMQQLDIYTYRCNKHFSTEPTPREKHEMAIAEGRRIAREKSLEKPREYYLFCLNEAIERNAKETNRLFPWPRLNNNKP